jgi:FAD/FMN-containing dehydrogenase
VLELNGALEKNNTGVDLRQLFIGSEGTLGIITEATLKLTRVPGQPRRLPLRRARSRRRARPLPRGAPGPFVMMAYEFFTERCLARLRRHRSVRSPLEADLRLLRAPRGGARRGPGARPSPGSPPSSSASWSPTAPSPSTARAGRRSLDPARGHQREPVGHGLPHKNDIALPIAELDAFCAELDASSRESYPGWEIASSATSATATSTST